MKRSLAESQSAADPYLSLARIMREIFAQSSSAELADVCRKLGTQGTCIEGFAALALGDVKVGSHPLWEFMVVSAAFVALTELRNREGKN
jgi:hypothetical protein